MDSVIFSLLIVNFEARLEQVIKQLKLSDFPSKVGIDVVSYFGSLEILLMFLRKLAELLLFANG